MSNDDHIHTHRRMNIWGRERPLVQRMPRRGNPRVGVSGSVERENAEWIKNVAAARDIPVAEVLDEILTKARAGQFDALRDLVKEVEQAEGQWLKHTEAYDRAKRALEL